MKGSLQAALGAGCLPPRSICHCARVTGVIAALRIHDWGHVGAGVFIFHGIPSLCTAWVPR
jgi:hypothetical protein